MFNNLRHNSVFLLSLFCFSVLIFSCNDKTDKQKINLELSFKVDSLLNDTVEVSLIVDSLKKQILETANDTFAIRLINELADRWRGANALVIAEEGLSQSRKLNYLFGIDEAKCKLAYYYARSVKFRIADSIANDVIKTTAFATLKSQATCILGEIERASSNFPKSIKYYEEAIKLTNSNDYARIIAANGGMADSYRKLSEFEKADSLLDLTIKMADQMNNNTVKIFCTIYKGEIVRAKADYVGALKYYDEALALSLKMREKYFLASCYVNMGDLYRLQNDYPNSLKSISKSLAIAKETNDERRMAVCYTSIGSIYVLQKEYTKAIYFF